MTIKNAILYYGMDYDFLLYVQDYQQWKWKNVTSLNKGHL